MAGNSSVTQQMQKKDEAWFTAVRFVGFVLVII